ncbi:MAG TPA: D-2-hydroxyacid dehydrogenase [bacterium]|nr:D-2-hydroxyacid dehydrogenase [bacterium]
MSLPRDRPTPRQKPVVAVLARPDGPPPPGLGPVAKVATIRHAASAQALAEALEDAEVLLVLDFRSTTLRDAWPRARHLRWIHVAAAGVDTVLFPELVSSSVTLTNSRGVFDQAIAEYVLGLILAFAKDFPATLDLQRRRVWQHRETEHVRGQTVLVVGAGGLGRAIGRLAGSAQMRVVGVARTARASDPDLGRVVAARDLSAALGEADYVVVAAPLTSETRGLIGPAAFGRMKPTARLINVGRGPIVDEAALLDALQTKRIAGAALDVFMQEPLPKDHPFWDLPGLIVSPHMSGDFVGWMSALSELFVENYARWRRGAPLLNVVDKTLGYVPSTHRPQAGVKDVPRRAAKSEMLGATPKHRRRLP